MRSIINLIAFAIIVVVLLAWALAPAFAFAADGVATPAGTPFQPLFEVIRSYILEVASGLIIVLIGWIARLIQRWTGIQIEKSRRDALHSAAMTGVTQALDEMGMRAVNLAVGARARVIAEGVEWVKKSVPDAVRYFGLDRPENASMIETIVASKLGQRAIEAGSRTTLER